MLKYKFRFECLNKHGSYSIKIFLIKRKLTKANFYVTQVLKNNSTIYCLRTFAFY